MTYKWVKLLVAESKIEVKFHVFQEMKDFSLRSLRLLFNKPRFAVAEKVYYFV